MGKIIGFELKKFVSKIGMYILVIALAGLLVAGIFMYKPTERKLTTYSLVGETISDMYTNFDTAKQGYLDNIENISIEASTYIASSPNYVSSNSKTTIDNLFIEFDDYCSLYKETNATPGEYATLKKGVTESLNKLLEALKKGLEPSKEQTGYYILTTSDNYTSLLAMIDKIYTNYSTISQTLASERYYNEYRTPLYNQLQQLHYPNLSKVASKYSGNGTYYTLTVTRMEEIAQKISEINTSATADTTLQSSDELKHDLNELFNRYVQCYNNYINSYKYSMAVEALNSINSKTERANIIGYSEIDLYQYEENALKYDYYIEHNTNVNEFANALSISDTSNGEINTYDFTYFVMSLFSIAVILFAIYLSAHTISGEISNNTMRMTAIRPVKRGSIFFGKYFAILIISLILLLFGTITSLIVGAIVFGGASSNILMLINGEYLFIAHPLAVIGIHMVSLLLVIAVYSALTLMLSSMLKSDLLAMIISVIIYVVNLILPLFFGKTSWLRFNPFNNINLFSYFGLSGANSTILEKLFNGIVYQGMNLWISLIYVIAIPTVLLLIGRHIFKRRDL